MTEDSVHYFSRLLRRDDEGRLWPSLLGKYGGENTAAESLDLRRSFCSDTEYYSEAYQHLRQDQAVAYIGSLRKRDIGREAVDVEYARQMIWQSQPRRQTLSLGVCQSPLSSFNKFQWLFLHFAFVAGLRDDNILSYWRDFLADFVACLRLTACNMPIMFGKSILTTLLGTLLYPEGFEFDDRRSAILSRGFHARFAIMEVAIRVWLETLESAGVNLQEYGSRELAALTSGEIRGEFPLDDIDVWKYRLTGKVQWNTHSNRNMTLRLLRIQYGPSSQDWKLWWTEPTDELVGEFWHRIEWEMPRIPGSWIEDED